MQAAQITLVEATRGRLVESVHLGSVVVLDADGPITGAGTVTRPVFARSALKPLQATAMVAAGFDGPATSLALASASHSGEDVHLRGVRAILAAAGLGETALQCPPALPRDADVIAAYVRAGGLAAPVCHNCSGKHAAMVATSAHNGWPVDSYLEQTHPLQQAIAETIVEHGGEPIATTSVDGCGAPAHAVSLHALARAMSSLARVPADEPGGRLVAAMRAHPQLVGGTGRAVTELTAAAGGLVCKDGAEGVWAAALPDGRAFAAKIADGAGRALGPVLAAVLIAWGFDNPVVRRWQAVPLLGGGRPVGVLRPSAELRDLLSAL